MRARFFFSLFLWCGLLAPAFGQTGPILEGYIAQARQHSHALRQRQFQLEQSLLALEEAKRLFLPDVGFGATYTLAAGGRSISLPIGDLLNPVYGTLNELTQSNQFPQLENIEEQFLPNNFYDARLRVRQPIVNAEIRYNRRIKNAQVSLQELEVQLYERELVKDLKTAYFRYLQANEAVGIYEQALRLLNESRRVNESLVRNNKAIPTVTVRTDGEIAAVRAQLAEAKGQTRNAAAYVNYLLGQGLDAELAIDSTFREPDTLTQGRREELEQLAVAREINALTVDLARAYHTPKIGAQLDLGSQAFGLDWGGYALLGLSLEVPLWNGGRNKLQTQQAQIAGLALAERLDETEALIELQIQTARTTLAAAREVWEHYRTQLTAATRFYDDTFRRYREGVANYIELLDARSQLTTLSIRRSIAYYDMLVKTAELERAQGNN